MTSGLVHGFSAIPEDLQERLSRNGLIELKKIPTLEELFDAYWESEYYDLKRTTQSSKRQSRRRFFEFADENASCDTFTKRDAAEFVRFLDNQVGEATRAGTIRDVRRVFNFGIEMELIETNPFLGIKRGSFKNKSREYYVPMEDFEKMIDAAPSCMWRAVLGLYRVGGLRYSEALLVEWRDVDFVGRRLLVHSPKTSRIKGKESRVIPLFPRLRELLEDLWETVPENGSPYVISENRTTIRKHVDRIVFDAGLNRWERLIQNLRSSCAIDVQKKFGELAESEWIGHSPQTAKDHYLHVLDADFEEATREAVESKEIAH
ncbi:MAG: tyrosine-type recombinase/integrase [Thermoguttaceae bacterium]